MTHVGWMPYDRPLKAGDRVRLGNRKLWLVGIVRGLGLADKAPTAVVSKSRSYKKGGARRVPLSKLKRTGKHS